MSGLVSERFQLLPTEILLLIWQYLPKEDKLSLLIASPVFTEKILADADTKVWAKEYWFGAVQSVPRLPPSFCMDADVNFATETNAFPTAMREILRLKRGCPRGEIILVVAASHEEAAIFSRNLERSDEAISVHLSDGDVGWDVRENFKKAPTVVVLVTHRLDGLIPRPRNTLLLSPRDSCVVFRAMEMGPHRLAVVWALRPEISKAYVEVTALFQHFDRSFCPEAVVRHKPLVHVQPL
jgi:hypothetical protein